jgi:hypothetical protein
MSDQNKKPDLYAYVVTTGKDKPYFDKIGAAWKNKKGGYNIRLTAVPLSGELILFPPKDGERE